MELMMPTILQEFILLQRERIINEAIVAKFDAKIAELKMTDLKQYTISQGDECKDL
jgi:hypothetical protein